jgi:hypothetical protein
MNPRAAAALLAAVAMAIEAAGAGASPEAFKPKKSRLDDTRVDRAVRQGLEFLKTAPSPASHHDMNGDELILYSLFIGGVPHDDPVFDRYLRKVVDKPPERTYTAALAAMCLSEMDRAGYQWKLDEIAQFLVNTQCQNGQWGYGEAVFIQKRPVTSTPPPNVRTGGRNASPPKAPPYGLRYPAGYHPATKDTAATLPHANVPQRRRGPPQGDNSNSQYAALGLRVCWEAAIDIDTKCLQDALKWWEDSQCGDGGWNYSRDWNWDTDGRRGWGSMTAGGIGSVVIYRAMLGLPYRGRIDSVNNGLKWMGMNWDLERNPGTKDLGASVFHYYYLYGLERVGMLYGTDLIGAHDWYDEGGAYLLDHQQENGAWKGEKGNEVFDTCFAILFLRRATKPFTPTGRSL